MKKYCESQYHMATALEGYIMPSIIEEFAQYKLLARDYEGVSSAEHFLNHPNAQKEVRQLCIKLDVYSFVRFSTVCSFLGDTKQVVGRMSLNSSVQQLWELLASRSTETAKELDKVFSQNLASEGFYVSDEGWVKPLSENDETASDLPGQADKGDKTVSKGQTKNA